MALVHRRALQSQSRGYRLEKQKLLAGLLPGFTCARKERLILKCRCCTAAKKEEQVYRKWLKFPDSVTMEASSTKAVQETHNLLACRRPTTSVPETHN
ncbi:hypothetical protein V1264_000016 [Littorina saxatilis]|uniref:Uncharacterized protein n=1 Tax=Littorina saxatilis TaxID=31220 RepID=A0AAN9GMM2_9CAEN